MKPYVMFQRKMGSVLLLALAVLAFACQQDMEIIQEPEFEMESFAAAEFVPGEYIIELQPATINFRRGGDYEETQVFMRELSESLLAEYRIGDENLRNVFGTAVDGFSVKLNEKELEMMRRDPRVKSIHQDEVIAHNRGNGNGGGNGGTRGGGPKNQTPSEPAPAPEEPADEPAPSDPDNPEAPEEPADEPKEEPADEPKSEDPVSEEPVEEEPYSGPSTQEVPWGIQRVGGFKRYTGNNVAFVLDTGIELDHPDLNVNVELGRKIVPDDISTTLSDLHSHGTHVAGIIGAIDNHFGVVGVAAGVQVVPVKIMGDDGRGRVSWAIAGVDYVASVGKPGDVANLSIGASANTTFDNAVINASNKGIWFVTSAGNNAADANNYSPARANGPFLQTVSSMDSRDVMANSSNYGNPPIDWAAPGVGIKSTILRGGYGNKSGTSMAAPHVAGLRLLGNIRADGHIKNDKDNTPDPIAHRAD
ncbi:S8 family serine peptidase [Indibacter alkaliphilus]|nr:S8 family serine peptidase [Indibacter alkaliphilus]